MKKAKVLLAGALVLALGLVMGCKQSVTSDPEIGEKIDNGWLIKEQKNNSSEYWRWLKTVGGSYKTATIDLEMSDPTAGKIGVIFGFNELHDQTTGKKNGKYSYYQFGVGVGQSNSANAGKLEYYISYYTNVDMNTVTGNNSAEGPAGITPVDVVAQAAVPENVAKLYTAGQPLKLSVKVTWTENAGYQLYVGESASNTVLQVGSGYFTNTKEKGDVGYYAMLTKDKSVTSSFKYVVANKSLLAAEEE